MLSKFVRQEPEKRPVAEASMQKLRDAHRDVCLRKEQLEYSRQLIEEELEDLRPVLEAMRTALYSVDQIQELTLEVESLNE